MIPSWYSNPSAVSISGVAITPALFTSTSIARPSPRISAPRASMVASEPMSTSFRYTSVPPPSSPSASSWANAPSAFAPGRQARTTSQPARRRPRTVSRPMPPEAPVTSARGRGPAAAPQHTRAARGIPFALGLKFKGNVLGRLDTLAGSRL